MRFLTRFLQTCFSVVSLLVLACPPLLAQANPNQIAILHWYPANIVTSFPVGFEPLGIAFDGANIWVANYGSFSLSKLRASDGALLLTANVGLEVDQLAFDGTNIWATLYVSNQVAKVRASDGAILGMYPVGSYPWGVAFDGTNIWVTNNAGNTISKLRVDTGAVVGTYPAGGGPTSLACDGANMWVVNNLGGTVTKLRSSDGPGMVPCNLPSARSFPQPMVRGKQWRLPAKSLRTGAYRGRVRQFGISA